MFYYSQRQQTVTCGKEKSKQSNELSDITVKILACTYSQKKFCFVIIWQVFFF